MWLNVASIQVASENLWHESQVVGKLDATWSMGDFAVVVVGLVARRAGARGHGEVVVAQLWHWEQGAVVWAPASGKYVAWLKADFWLQVASVFLWQLSQVVGESRVLHRGRGDR